MSVIPELVATDNLTELDVSNNLLAVLPYLILLLIIIMNFDCRRYEISKFTQLRKLFAQNNVIRCLFPNPIFDKLEILSIHPSSFKPIKNTNNNNKNNNESDN